ncbi:hypothetical protein pdam_00016069 [Pocillopora damicornis]|uniref:Thyroglobulin type-1 domain-containing protein n=1 Tax=Pocillopora damicornis TaxID=46731 RepID=A0A3M6TVN5_POCDA|nr:hypothetical protein pdam_00016069 [Pocillopora damicornis]
MPTKLFMLCSLIFSTCQGLQFNVSRVALVTNLGSKDLFTNLDPSAKCPNEKPNLDAGRPWCVERKAYCSSQGCCVCECQYSDATFQLKMNPYNASCVGNKDIRTFAGCSKLFESEASAHPLIALDPSASGFKGIINLSNKCKVKSVEYLDITWKPLAKKDTDTFSISSIKNWPYTALLLRGPDPTAAVYLGINSIEKIWKLAMCFCFSLKVPTSKAKTTENTKSTIIMADNTSTTESQVLTDHPSETLPTESTAGDFATLEPTHHSSGNKEPENNENKFSAQKQDKLEDMMIFIVIGVAAVICISVGLLCTWLIISQRRKHRNAESYGAGTTVIANPTTGAQVENYNKSQFVLSFEMCFTFLCWAKMKSFPNHFPMTGFFKNPVCDDAVYMEPEALVRKSSVSLIGNPSYENCEDLLINNPGAKNSQQILLNNATKKSLNTSSRNIIPTKENSYDCAHVRSHNNGKPDQDKPVYQSLVEADVEASCTSDPNLNTYQSLNPDGLIYQPLIKSVVQERQYEVPEYLALLNPGETPGKNLPSPPEYQPPYTTGPPPADLEESPEYADYADLDELEKISANEASNKSLNGEQCYLTPLHNVPEGPNYDYANASVYDVLEGPDPHIYGSVNLGFEPPAPYFHYCLIPLACPSTTGTPTTQLTTTGTTGPPITPSTITSTPTITTTKPITTPDQAINAAIVVIGIILCLLLIGVFAYLLHQYTILCPCRRRGHQIGGGIMNSNVINNLGQPTFRIQEEPVYAEVADVYPLENKAKGKVTVNLDESPSVVLNLYAQEVGFSRGRLNPDSPLSRSNLEGIRRTSDESRNVRERDRSLQEEETDGSLHNNSSSQDGKELPEYNILEPEESEQELRPDEPVNHEYNILEPETPSDDVQSDMNETFPNSGSTDEEKDLPIHPSEIKSLENNPVYAFHWKMKNDEPCARRRARSM